MSFISNTPRTTSSVKDGSSRQILLLDDSTDSRHAYARLLTHAGFTVIEAATIAEALLIMRSVHVDLLLADLELPDGWSWKLPTELQGAQGKYVPSIAVSAHCYPHHVAKALGVGYDAYLAKPHTIEHLLAVIAKSIPT
jgi:DNA-binding response OmpR family regulator